MSRTLIIPRVADNVPTERLMQVFRAFGFLSFIQEVSKTDRFGAYKCAFMVFESINNDARTRAFLRQIGDEGSARYYYDDDESWVVREPNATELAELEQIQRRERVAREEREQEHHFQRRQEAERRQREAQEEQLRQFQCRQRQEAERLEQQRRRMEEEATQLRQFQFRQRQEAEERERRRQKQAARAW